MVLFASYAVENVMKLKLLATGLLARSDTGAVINVHIFLTEVLRGILSH